ncbi:MAG: polysaccharide biosynthesis/export family protein [Acidobacteria bacterium]|nr:polysaccharide biosynthesis/export family protein [Acidobacteriota bacterium]
MGLVLTGLMESAWAAEKAKAVENPAEPATTLDYRIGPGDVLAVEVWREPESSMPGVLVRPDGRISLSMIGELVVAGMSTAELERVLVEKYKEFIHDVRLTVIVKEIHSQKVYVMGEVKKPGAIQLQASITIVQALAEAGGFTEYANRKKIYILRARRSEKTGEVFNYEELERGQGGRSNVMLAPGDTVVVPR